MTARHRRVPTRSSSPRQYPLEGRVAIGLAEGNELVAKDLEARLPHQLRVRLGRETQKNVGAPSQSPVQASVSLVPSAVISRPRRTSQRRIRAKVGASSSRGT